MSTESLPPPHPRSLTVSIPPTQAQPTVSSRRPNLREILQNAAPPPWTLSAFMAYLSQNHCLETLEFTMDATRYRKRYSKMVTRSADSIPRSSSTSPSDASCSPDSSPPNSEDRDYVKMLWRRLMEAYIMPNGPREVNLPGDVRNALLALSDPDSDAPPPLPSSLEAAVEKTFELMEESVLVPFLNSVGPHYALPDAMDVEVPQGRSHSSHRHSHAQSYDLSSSKTNSASRSRSNHNRFSSRSTHKPPPSSTSSSSITTSLAGGLGVAGISPLPDNAGFTEEPGVASGTAGWGSPAGSTHSTATDAMMTPPITPPASEYGSVPAGNGCAAGLSTTSGGNTPSPRSSRIDPVLNPTAWGSSAGLGAAASAASWRRMGQKLGFKKKGQSFRDDEEMSGM